MSKVDPNDFLLNTDYELDKIILVKTGDFIQSANIKHGLSFTPLVFGVWSTDKDFTTTNTLGPVPEESPTPGAYTPPLGVGCRANDNKIMFYTAGEGNTTTRVYYRLYAFAPSKQNVNAPLTSSQAKQLILNTDYNYRKIKDQGEFTQSNINYKHGLGYIPQVMAWIQYADLPNFPDYSNAIEPLADTSFYTDYRFIITNDEIKVPSNFPFSLIAKVIWRIYYDEA